MTFDMKQFLLTFFEESFEGLDVMESALLNLDVGAADAETINTIFRAAHSIKGGSATFGLSQVSVFTHSVETLLDEMRNGKRAVTRDNVDLLLKSVDCMREMLQAARDGGQFNADKAAAITSELEMVLGKKPATQSAAVAKSPDKEAAGMGWKISLVPHADMLKTGNDPIRMFRELQSLGKLEVILDATKLPALVDLVPEDIFISWDVVLYGDATLDQVREVFDWVEGDCELSIIPLNATDVVAAEMQATTLDASQQAVLAVVPKPDDRRAGSERRAPAATVDAGSIRVAIDKIDALINMVGELVITQSMLHQLGTEFDMSRLAKLQEGLGQLERNTRELQESVMRIRMLPISFAFNRFPRMAHDLSQKLNKKVELKMSGEQTELDKTVMEKIGDPLVHLVRNSIDHGIELPAVRRAAGKSDVGTVHLNAYHQGGNIVIEISDDGAGIDKDRIRKKAIERGLLAESDVVSDERIYELIFEPGFSTAEIVSDVSGRGVGMDVVRRNIKDLGGTVDIRTQLGAGATFTIRLPLTLAILDGQLVRVGKETYILPLTSIVESLQIKRDSVNIIAGRSEVYRLRDEYLPIVRLYRLFGQQPDSEQLEGALLVIVEGDGKRIGLLVDDLLNQQQVVIKSLESNFAKVTGISGATILGDGRVALIMDVAGLIKSSKDLPPQSGSKDWISKNATVAA